MSQFVAQGAINLIAPKAAQRRVEGDELEGGISPAYGRSHPLIPFHSNAGRKVGKIEPA